MCILTDMLIPVIHGGGCSSVWMCVAFDLQAIWIKNRHVAIGII